MNGWVDFDPSAMLSENDRYLAHCRPRGVGRERPLSRQRGASTPIALDPIVQGGGASCGSSARGVGRSQFADVTAWLATHSC
jgi:hypothetical protein